MTREKTSGADSRAGAVLSGGAVAGATRCAFAAAAVAILLIAEPAAAFDALPSGAGQPPSDGGPGSGGGSLVTGPAVAAAGRPAALREVGFDQNLGARLPADLPFRDESGREVKLAHYLGARPILLQLAYYRCPMLCPIVLAGLASSLKTLPFDAGDQFEVVVVGIDPTETPEMAAQSKRETLARYGRPQTASGWHFLTGPAASIAALSQAVGFRYVWDEQSQQYAHAAGVVLLTPDGRVSRYFFGAEFSPRDLRLGMVEATGGRVGTVVDQLLLFCFHYDPAMGRYSATALGWLRVAGAVTVLLLGAFIALSLRRDLRGRAAGRPAR
jgi:protein SCO1